MGGECYKHSPQYYTITGVLADTITESTYEVLYIDD